MKKIFAALLTLAMLLALTACSGDTTPSSAPAGDTTTPDTQSTPNAENPAYDTVELMFATTYNEIEASGKAITYFTDYITEKSGGAITFDIKWGGTVAGSGEELSFLQAGAFDMSVLGQSQYSAVLPLLNFPGQTDESRKHITRMKLRLQYFHNARKTHNRSDNELPLHGPLVPKCGSHDEGRHEKRRRIVECHAG